MILQHVADHAGFFIVRAAVLDAKRLGHGDLHMVDIALVPDRLPDRVGEAKVQNVLHGFLAKVVVDAIDLRLVEHAEHGMVELARARQVAAERLFDHDARPARAGIAALHQPGLAELFDDRRKKRGQRGQIKNVVAGSAALPIDRREQLFEAGKGIRFVDIAGRIEQPLHERVEHRIVDGSFVGDTLAQPVAKIIVAQRRARNADGGKTGRQLLRLV